MTVDEMTLRRDALLDARAKAVRTIEFEGRRVSYATDAEMAAAIADLERRIDAARTAISVITLAEARFGCLKADWGPRRIAHEERRLQAWGQLPLDEEIVDEWARLRAASVARP